MISPLPKVGEVHHLCTALTMCQTKAPAMSPAMMAMGCITLAGPGEILGLQDLLMERQLESSIVTKSDVMVWRVPSKALKAILRNCPDLSLHLFRLALESWKTAQSSCRCV